MHYTFETIKRAFENLQDYANQYQQEDLQNELQTTIANRLAMEYRIAIVANMNAGKSTFINALFGEEILPAFHHATSDCAIYITSTQDKGALVHFSNKDPIVIFYDNHESFIKELQQYAQKDEECDDDKYKNVERIDLYYPLKGINTQNAGEMRIIFIDTPGPNATGDYAEKHKVQTRSVLNDVDLALFLFDYGQLDANLSSDKQGLWEIIKERAEKDKSFEVFFMLNKIDMALDDNKKYESEWFYHEQKAIDKLRQAAIKHGISAPQIYPVSSLYALLHRKANKHHNDEDRLELFEKKFKRKFGDEWENRLVTYLGIEAFTKAINAHIAHKPQKRWEELAAKIKEMVAVESHKLLWHGTMEQTMGQLYDDEIWELKRGFYHIGDIMYDAINNSQLQSIPPQEIHEIAENITKTTIMFLHYFITNNLNEIDAQNEIQNFQHDFHFTLDSFHKIKATYKSNLRINPKLRNTIRWFIQEQLETIENYSETIMLKSTNIQLPRKIIAHYNNKDWAINGILVAKCIENYIQKNAYYRIGDMRIFYNILIEKIEEIFRENIILKHKNIEIFYQQATEIKNTTQYKDLHRIQKNMFL